jgi:hypothetical protein
MAVGCLVGRRHGRAVLAVGAALVAGSGVIDAMGGGHLMSPLADVLAASGVGLLFSAMVSRDASGVGRLR